MNTFNIFFTTQILFIQTQFFKNNNFSHYNSINGRIAVVNLTDRIFLFENDLSFKTNYVSDSLLRQKNLNHYLIFVSKIENKIKYE